MIAPLIALLFPVAAIAQGSTAPEFITGYRKYPVRITLPDLGPLKVGAESDSGLIRLGMAQIKKFNALIAICEARKTPCDLRFYVNNWRQVFTLGTLMALESNPGWVAANPGALHSVRTLFSVLSPVSDESAPGLARQAVQPFRDNWLYSAADAPVLNELERWLARGWSRNLMELTALPQPSFDLPLYWTGNPTADAVRDVSNKNTCADQLNEDY